MTSSDRPSGQRTVEVAHSRYQPSQEELAEDLRVDATFEEAVQALAQPVKLRYIKHPKRKR